MLFFRCSFDLITIITNFFSKQYLILKLLFHNDLLDDLQLKTEGKKNLSFKLLQTTKKLLCAILYITKIKKFDWMLEIELIFFFHCLEVFLFRNTYDYSIE